MVASTTRKCEYFLDTYGVVISVNYFFTDNTKILILLHIAKIVSRCMIWKRIFKVILRSLFVFESENQVSIYSLSNASSILAFLIRRCVRKRRLLSSSIKFCLILIFQKWEVVMGGCKWEVLVYWKWVYWKYVPLPRWYSNSAFVIF